MWNPGSSKVEPLTQISLPLPPAFRSPGYRAFWLGSIASVSGFQILRFGQFWLVFQLTGSPLALGYVGLANGVPAIFLNLFGGVAADKLDQRLLIMVSQTITSGLILVLAFLALFNQSHHVACPADCVPGRGG